MTLRPSIFWKRYAAFLALWGLVLQLAVTAFAIPAAFAASIPVMLPPGYSVVVICTGRGMTQVILDADNVPVEERHTDSGMNACHACKLTCGSSLAPAAGQTVPVVHAPVVRLAPIVDGAVMTTRCCGPPESRGPPLDL